MKARSRVLDYITIIKQDIDVDVSRHFLCLFPREFIHPVWKGLAVFVERKRHNICLTSTMVIGLSSNESSISDAFPFTTLMTR
ncbi:hypothetical protein CPA40_02315 [Bifidobacterium callitrichos]|uniref:Uncharacterized protein n=1 Tax=Bifidobacterium callitrichos TaxID=762209 RepID=A0A2T3GCH5_9BIFI|nr:hypothetical protein CPA40_02315 [Bifidobacterium callitrichos]